MKRKDKAGEGERYSGGSESEAGGTEGSDSKASLFDDKADKTGL